MDKVTYVKSQLKLEHWRKLIAECQSSGMKVKYWCAQHEISKDQYYYWLRKVREAYVDNLPVESMNLPSCPQDEHIAFRPLEVKSPVAGTSAAIAVHLPQATIEVPDGMSRSTIEAVLLALKSVC